MKTCSNFSALRKSGADWLRQLLWLLLAGLLASRFAFPARANPQGMTVSSGTANATQHGSQLTIQASQNSVINWQSFNIRPGETTTFLQPSARSVVWNRIFDQNPSQIWGHLNANGYVVLMNQNGFYFGPNSVINVGGFLATVAPLPPPEPGGGSMWQFNGAPPAASIVNYGRITASSGSSVYLIAERVENHGQIVAREGTIGLQAGKEVLVSERPDGRGLSATVRLPEGSVDNSGQLIADAGTIALHAQVVNQGGLIQANSVRQQNGIIELVGSEAVNLGAGSVLRANGDANAVSDGGRVTIQSAGRFSDTPASQIDVSGGRLGGNGGQVEISAVQMPAVESHLDGAAKPHWKGGSLLLDPTDIILGTEGNGSAGSGTVNSTDGPDTLRLNVNSAFVGFSQIHLEATRDISLNPYTVWSLNDSTGMGDAQSLLTLEAGRNIVFGDGSRIASSSGWSLRLAAGVDFSSSQHSVPRGIGSIYLNGGAPDVNGQRPNGNGALETADGSISLEAGHEVLVGGGYIRTVGGGNISITTHDGDVDAGNKPDGYQFSRQGYTISPAGLGGIGTAYGGDVFINSGHDILSFGPTSGAYGSGNVTLRAQDRILGSYLVSDGRGRIDAGTDVGSGSSPVSLSLINGGWDVIASRDIYLNEVLNPNGVFNNNRVGGVRFRFDYSPDAYVHLTAGNSVQLLGNAPAHLNDNRDRPPIYAPQLVIEAGAGGVVLGNDLVLYPSAFGELQITTTDGGSLRSTPGNFFQLIMSDSGSTDYRTFAQGHASTPLYLPHRQHPVSLQIDGDVQNIFLRSPKRTEIAIGGNALNFSFEGQNLHANDVSRLTIAGDYFSRSDRTFATLGDAPMIATFDAIFSDPLTSANPDLGAHLTYNPTTHTLGFQGRMTAADRDFLLHPVGYVIDPLTELPKVDANGNPVLFPMTFTMDQAAINRLYANSQDIPISSLAFRGLQIGGPGQLVVSARNMDLGISQGIRSVGTLLNSSLAVISLAGADLNISLAGNLDMTSSQIASYNGGSITLKAPGHLNVGSQEQFTSDDTPKGIYTGHGGDVDVESAGDINVNGSRIGSYDGGDVKVVSTDGSIDAGSGARGFFTVTTQQLDPKTGQLELRNDRYFGSGIVALTRTDSDSQIGNISVIAGKDILANSGGILQLAFNHSDLSHATVTMDAGRNIEANESGVLGANVILHAKGDITGLIVANQNINIDAGNKVNVSALGGGAVNVSGATVSGSIIGGGNVSVSGDVNAQVISVGGTATGGNAGGAFSGVAAPVAQQTTTEAEKKVAAKATDNEDEEEKKKRAAKAPVLSKTTGRVTVILPNKQ